MNWIASDGFINCNIAANNTVPPPAPTQEVIIAVKNENVAENCRKDNSVFNSNIVWIFNLYIFLII